MTEFSNFFGALLGLGHEAKDLTFIQISLRAVIVFLATLIMVRLGHKRSLARKSAFDAILLVILASFLRARSTAPPLSFPRSARALSSCCSTVCLRYPPFVLIGLAF